MSDKEKQYMVMDDTNALTDEEYRAFEATVDPQVLAEMDRKAKENAEQLLSKKGTKKSNSGQ